MKYALFLLVAFLASTFAAISSPVVTGPCPNGAGYQIDSSNLPTAERFLLNAFHYNKNDLQNGSPKGPYFSIDASKPSSFKPNGALEASLILFADEARTDRIGTAELSATLLSVSGDANQYVDGDIRVTTHFSALRFSGEEYSNYRDQSKLVHFEGKNVHATSTTPSKVIANRLEEINGKLYITLWGSAGWNASLGKFEQSGQGMGIDIRFGLSCPVSQPPPIVEGCPCEANLQSESYADYEQGTLVSHRGSPCVSLTWA